ncbi:hypothetical protein BVRB_8g184970 [Beta vulgaris subsp. vulgaris]|uniref:Uncharacterized protein n=1 Tax=Beta vulgaris subsp. vulgaris TaxID=3555 RepID=A0A0J8BSQ1_BETVV|nr:hypothetical protein BVRB_8g184970 [Beta vulgaris subsp. vulgaris]
MRTPLDSLCSRIRGGEAKSDVGGSKRRPLDTSDSGEREEIYWFGSCVINSSSSTLL